MKIIVHTEFSNCDANYVAWYIERLRRGLSEKVARDLEQFRKAEWNPGDWEGVAGVTTYEIRDDTPEETTPYRQCTHCATQWTGDANICPTCIAGLAWVNVPQETGPPNWWHDNWKTCDCRNCVYKRGITPCKTDPNTGEVFINEYVEDIPVKEVPCPDCGIEGGRHEECGRPVPVKDKS